MKFTVVIPTFKRADMLRIALRSVSLQTAKGLINKVIVSENGLNRDSESVCKEFSDLPIHYIYQQNQLTVQKHMQWLMSQEQENYVALLCDDDWWDIHHLAMASDTLTNNSSCVAYFSNFTYAETPHSLKKQTYYSGVEALHFNKTEFVNYKPNIYNKEHIFLFSLLITPFHFSSMICRGDVLVKSVKNHDELHPTYADRILYPLISTFGDVIFNPLKTAIILFHQSMDSHNYGEKEWINERQNGSVKLLNMAAENGISIENTLNDFFISSNDEDAAFVSRELASAFPDREKIGWFAGIKDIRDNDIANSNKIIQYSFKRRVINKLVGIVKSVL